MKAIIVCFVAIFSSFAAFAQSVSFKSVALQQVRGHETLKFTPARDVNVRNYRIEASNDGSSFEVIAAVPPKSNTVFAQEYSYDLSAQAYAYYRVGQVTMGGQVPYSATVGHQAHAPVNEKPNNNPVIVPGDSIVKE